MSRDPRRCIVPGCSLPATRFIFLCSSCIRELTEDEVFACKMCLESPGLSLPMEMGDLEISATFNAVAIQVGARQMQCVAIQRRANPFFRRGNRR